MNVEIKMGESVRVTLAGTDGEFVVTYGKRVLKVTAEFPDSKGRVGTIYKEEFGKDFDKSHDPADQPTPWGQDVQQC